MNIQKLQQAKEFILQIPQIEFDIKHWWLSDGKYFHDDRGRMITVRPGQCGCAVGHMAQRGLFGLGNELFEEDRSRVFSILGDLFEFGMWRAQFVFDSYFYPQPQDSVIPEQVARRIDFLISEEQDARAERGSRALNQSAP